MVAGLLLWGGAYLGTVVFIAFASTPNHPLPAYLIFEAACLLPWTVWLLVKSARKGTATGIAVIATMCAAFLVDYIAEVSGTCAHLWTFSRTRDALVGVSISGVPVEEFLFYPLVINFSILLYFWICDFFKKRRVRDIRISRRALAVVLLGTAGVFTIVGLAVIVWGRSGTAVPLAVTEGTLGIPRYGEGARTYVWTLICLFSVAASLAVLYVAERTTALMLRAALALSSSFLMVCLMVELVGTGRGWWVFNGQASSGLWVGGIPVENIPTYLTGVIIPVSILEFIRKIMGERGMP